MNASARTQWRQVPDFDFDADAGDRLMKLLTGSTLQQRLGPAARIAGRQLELMKPALAGVGPGGFHASVVSAAPIGATVVVLADGQRVASTFCHLLAGYSTEQALHQMVAAAEACGAPVGGWGSMIAGVINAILDRAGVQPGDPCPGLVVGKAT